MTEAVRYSRQDAVGTITLDDGKANALSIPTLHALHEALDAAERDGVVVVLRGRDGLLSGGFDLATFRDHPERVPEMLHLGATLMQRILAHPRPVLVACPGHAVAAGAFLLLSADVRIGADGPFRIGLNEVRIGLTMPWFAIELARARLAPADADNAVVTGRMYAPAEARDAGFLDRTVAPGDLEAATAETAKDLASLDPAAHTATKQRFRAGTLTALRAAIERELGAESAQPTAS